MLPPGVFAAGEVTGVHDLAASLLHGRVAGLEAAARIDGPSPQSELDGLRRQVAQSEASIRDGISGRVNPPAPSPGKKSFVCICEDVTAKDVSQAIEEGFDDIQLLKRYSTASMGPCQGKMCLKVLVSLCAQSTGRSIEETGVTTARAPLQPVPLAA